MRTLTSYGIAIILVLAALNGAAGLIVILLSCVA
jgi:hypothetical protein